MLLFVPCAIKVPETCRLQNPSNRTDTPGSITADQYVKGNSGGTALEFGSPSGAGTVTTVEIGDTALDTDIASIDFDTTYFAGTESPENEANITLDLTPSSGNATLVAEEDAVQVNLCSQCTEDNALNILAFCCRKTLLRLDHQVFQ